MDINDSKENPKEQEDLPPFFKSWNQLYGFVIGQLLFLIVAFYFFTKIFE